MVRSLGVRVEDEEQVALDLLMAYLRGRCGPGVRIGESDAIRYALHAAANLVAVEMADQQQEESASGR